MIKSRNTLWITVFIYLSVFINSITFFTQPFEFYFGYLIFILLLPVFVSRYSFNRNLFYIFLVLLITGVANILLGNDTGAQFFKVYIGLALSYFFYHYVIQEYDFNVEQLFKWYLKGAYIVSVIGVIQFISFQINFRPGYDYSWLLNKWGVVPGGNFGIRVNSIFGEPTYLAATLSAAFFVSIHNLIRKECFYLSRFKSFIIISVYILSFSGLAQTGLFLSLLFLALNFGLLRYFVFVVPAALILFNVFYNNVREFRERLDSVVALFSGEEFKLGKTHGSSFILYNNYKVATENFKTNFLFGTGIGSHPVAFQKFSLAKKFKVYGFNLNSADANSMLLRLISETGLFGVGIFFFIIFKFYVSRDDLEDSYHWLISNAILVMILLNLLRQGHYFLNGFPFFVLLYIYNYLSYTKQLPNQEELDIENTKHAALSAAG